MQTKPATKIRKKHISLPLITLRSTVKPHITKLLIRLLFQTRADINYCTANSSDSPYKTESHSSRYNANYFTAAYESIFNK